MAFHHNSKAFTTNKSFLRHNRSHIAAGIFIALPLRPKQIDMKIENANVLITGGASGIGKMMGRMALQKGARTFIIWDINIAAIEATRKELCRFGNVKGYVVDVANNDIVNTA